eukprot:TRINITY_DN29943_c0_g2_i1.p1 TRINITY_DN29943_c0_g2~~TRINITY_DN29943_c0_g2_i1.p1  ORF type:complete len:661 (+),score=126.89 TRINITY_DN29943_c0_g2_i1:152-2134(+)
MFGRCLVFWAAPISFLLFAVPLDPHGRSVDGGVLVSIALPLIALLIISCAGFISDASIRKGRGACMFVQIVLQIGVICYCSTSGLSGGVDAAAVVAASSPGGSPGGVAVPAAAVAVGASSASLRGKAADFVDRVGGELVLSDDEASRGRGTISVVIPCLNETSNMVNTVRRFCERTPRHLLEEIIVVDDGSKPFLRDILSRAHLDTHCNLRVLRHDVAKGLMVAKQTGGDAARGEFIGFFDCHVCPNKIWYEEVIQLLKQKTRRLVVPQIGDLNMSSWDEREHGALTAKCYMSWNGEFWWYEDESDYIPAISGGLVATTREWWVLSGGFDKGMRGWGGENTEQSLRVWLCGGDIVRAKSSRVAHMWRTNDEPATVAKYSMTHVQTDNLARQAALWYDQFKFVFRSGSVDLDGFDVAESAQRKVQLGCKPFVYFLHRFRKLYRDGGMLPKEVFKIRAAGTENCIQRWGDNFHMTNCRNANFFHGGNWVPPDMVLPVPTETPPAPKEKVVCGGHSATSCDLCPRGHGSSWCNADCAWAFGQCIDKARYDELLQHRKQEPCCSGIRQWRALECFDRLDANGPFAYACDLVGSNGNQQYRFDDEGRIVHFSGQCVSTGEGNALQSAACDSATRWEQIETFEPAETKLYYKLVRDLNLPEDGPDH